MYNWKLKVHKNRQAKNYVTQQKTKTQIIEHFIDNLKKVQ